MDLTILMEKLNTSQINKDAVDRVESVYNTSLSGELQKIVSVSVEPIHADGWRTLSLDEICDANDCLGVDCSGNGLLPVMDIMDNNFVVYDINEKCWKLFDIVDEIEYSEASTIEGLFEI